ncbi:MAG: hypothetical protein K2G04_03890 [Oscillospiraceae bacterium]|nr:hypothetical protein [Oscillospiraceae bacterium]
MKEVIYNFFTAGLALLILYCSLHSMYILGSLGDYNYIIKAAEKNSGLAAAGYDIPAVTDGTPAEEMRAEPAPVTDEELSYIYIDGVRFDFPFTLADIREYFETRKYISSYDEEAAEYSGAEILMKNGIGVYRIAYAADTKEPSTEECVVKSIAACTGSVKYSPQVTVAGIDVFRTPKEDIIRLAALDGNEYLTSDKIVRPAGEDGYAALNFDRGYIAYYKKDDPKDMAKIEKITPMLIKTELRLPEGHSLEDLSAEKEELRDFALEYYAYDEADTSLFTLYSFNKRVAETLDSFNYTAYEFLALPDDEYDALYYELTDIEGLMYYDSEGTYSDTGYLKVKANCFIEGYDGAVETDMLLKAGGRLGDALIIHINA